MVLTGKELERVLAVIGHRSPTELDAIGRDLRNAMIVPKGGRGPHAPAFSAENAAAFLIGMAGAQNANAAADAVRTLGPLRPVGGRYESFLYAETFGEAVAAIFERLETSQYVSLVRCCQTRPMAEIVWKEGGGTKRGVYAEADIEPSEDGTISVCSAVWGELGDGLLGMVALKLHAPTESGWAGAKFGEQERAADE